MIFKISFAPASLFQFGSVLNSFPFHSESLIISGGENGELLVWDTSNGNLVRSLEGHKGDIFCCNFFPSGEVMLSGGGDLKVKIWSLATGNCAATLSGHVGGIVSLFFFFY